MAAIIQVDPYQCLSHKIGYSVGLEKLVERVQRLVALYEAERGLTLASFVSLVEEGFGRKGRQSQQKSERGKDGGTTTSQHFANFYRSLNLIRVSGRTVEPLYQLDTLAILRRLFAGDEERFRCAVEVILTQCLIEADGDILLNGILSDFQKNRFRILLEAMVDEKDRRAASVFRTPATLAKIRQIIFIKNQAATQPEGDGVRSADSGSRFAKRTVPLSANRRTANLMEISDSRPPITDDYIDKVSQTRKGWAEDLGLFAEGERTARADELLSELFASVLATSNCEGCALFWGYATDLAKIRVTPSELNAPDCHEWTMLSAIHAAYRATQSENKRRKHKSLAKADGLIAFLEEVFSFYRDALEAKSLIRNSLPIYIAEPVIAAWCTAQDEDLPRMHDMLEDEFKKRIRRVQKMNIRGTAGALYFMRKP